MKDNTQKGPKFAPYWPHFAPYWGCPGPFLRCAYVDQNAYQSESFGIDQSFSQYYLALI